MPHFALVTFGGGESKVEIWCFQDDSSIPILVLYSWSFTVEKKFLEAWLLSSKCRN